MVTNLNLLTTCLLFALIGCNSNKSQNLGEPLVKVGDKILYSSVVNQLINEGTNIEDSTAIVSGYIENWVRNNLVILEAEKNIPANLNLNQLVQDYRSSLLMYHFENQLINKKLDTIITDQQKQDFYEEYGTQFILSHKIISVILIKSSANDGSFSSWVKKMKTKNNDQLLQEAKKNKYTVIYDGSKWLPSEDIKNIVSDVNVSNLKKDYQTQIKNKSGQYFVKILSGYNENDIPPLQYIDKKIVQVMLNSRKTELLKSMREELYQKNLNSRKIKYYQ
ncbi:MAG: hypothetical protein WAT79_15295 [Saprospiraceae bacterium]